MWQHNKQARKSSWNDTRKKGYFWGFLGGLKRGQKMAFFEVRATRSRCVERVKFVVHEQILWCKHIKRDELQRWRRKTSKNRFWADFPGPDTLSGPGKPRKWPFLSTQKSMQQRVEHRSTSSLHHQKTLFEVKGGLTTRVRVTLKIVSLAPLILGGAH